MQGKFNFENRARAAVWNAGSVSQASSKSGRHSTDCLRFRYPAAATSGPTPCARRRAAEEAEKWHLPERWSTSTLDASCPATIFSSVMMSEATAAAGTICRLGAAENN